jgi:hypothetical protein
MNKRRLGTIIIILILLFIFGAIFLFFDSFYGNPIGAAIAKYKITNYVQAKYPDMNLNISKVKYNFKNDSYFSVIQSSKVNDISFNVYFSSGELNDTYKDDVTGRYKTFDRLSREFDSKLEEIISKNFEHDIDFVIADFVKEDYDLRNLTLDMPLDLTNPPLPAYLSVHIFSHDVNYETLSSCLMELYNIMNHNNIPIDFYSVIIREPLPEGEKAAPGGESLYLFDFPAKKVQSEDLIAAIKEQMKAYEEEHEK